MPSSNRPGTPLVSVIVASFNKDRYICETISSIVGQTYSNLELIIVDDASDDQTVKVVRSHFTDDRIRLECNKINKGANFSRNRGIEMARGEFVVFVDADDVMSGDCIEQRLKRMSTEAESDFCVFSMGVFKKRVGDSAEVWHPRGQNPLREFLTHRLPWAIIQPMWRTDFLREIGGFDPSFERLQDVELHTRALLHPGVAFSVFPGKPDCFFRINDERKNFKVCEFMARWVRSAVKYYNKFYHLAPLQSRKYLIGTIYKAHSQLSYHFRKAELTREQFKNLEYELMSIFERRNLPKSKKWILDFANFYKTNLPLVPGVNKTLETLLIHL